MGHEIILSGCASSYVRMYVLGNIKIGREQLS